MEEVEDEEQKDERMRRRTGQCKKSHVVVV